MNMFELLLLLFLCCCPFIFSISVGYVGDQYCYISSARRFDEYNSSLFLNHSIYPVYPNSPQLLPDDCQALTRMTNIPDVVTLNEPFPGSNYLCAISSYYTMQCWTADPINFPLPPDMDALNIISGNPLLVSQVSVTLDTICALVLKSGLIQCWYSTKDRAEVPLFPPAALYPDGTLHVVSISGSCYISEDADGVRDVFCSNPHPATSDLSVPFNEDFNPISLAQDEGLSPASLYPLSISQSSRAVCVLYNRKFLKYVTSGGAGCVVDGPGGPGSPPAARRLLRAVTIPCQFLDVVKIETNIDCQYSYTSDPSKGPLMYNFEEGLYSSVSLSNFHLIAVHADQVSLYVQLFDATDTDISKQYQEIVAAYVYARSVDRLDITFPGPTMTTDYSALFIPHYTPSYLYSFTARYNPLSGATALDIANVCRTAAAGLADFPRYPFQAVIGSALLLTLDNKLQGREIDGTQEQFIPNHIIFKQQAVQNADLTCYLTSPQLMEDNFLHDTASIPLDSVVINCFKQFSINPLITIINSKVAPTGYTQICALRSYMCVVDSVNNLILCWNSVRTDVMNIIQFPGKVANFACSTYTLCATLQHDAQTTSLTDLIYCYQVDSNGVFDLVQSYLSSNSTQVTGALGNYSVGLITVQDILFDANGIALAPSRYRFCYQRVHSSAQGVSCVDDTGAQLSLVKFSIFNDRIKKNSTTQIEKMLSGRFSSPNRVGYLHVVRYADNSAYFFGSTDAGGTIDYNCSDAANIFWPYDNGVPLKLTAHSQRILPVVGIEVVNSPYDKFNVYDSIGAVPTQFHYQQGAIYNICQQNRASGSNAVSYTSLCSSSCDVGNYGAHRYLQDSKCDGSCPPGKYCPDALTIECAAGTFNSKDSQLQAASCDICPTGSYCTSGAADFTNCPAGRYGSRTGLQTASCTAICPPGSACKPGSTAATLCLPGFFSPSAGSSSCLAADLGYYVAATNSSRQIPCSPGFYQDSTGTSVCRQCDLGRYSNSTAGSTCPYCDPGRFSSSLNSTVCSNCAAGYYSGTRGSSSCTSCPPGYYCLEGSSSGTASLCPAGTVGLLASNTNSSCSWPCPAGFFCLNGTTTNYNKCWAGHVCALGSSIPLPIKPGYVGYPNLARSANNNSGQTLCPAGSSCNNGIITLCNKGYYSQPGSVTCTPALAGSFVNSSGSDRSFSCAAGFYSSFNGSSGCIPCAIGTASALPAASQCSSCSPGYYSNSTGLTQCFACPAGKYSNTYNSPRCIDCIAGQYSAEIARNSACDPCAEGTYSNKSSSTRCDSCDFRNKEVAKPGSTYCTKCILPQFPDVSHANCFQQACTVGTYYNVDTGLCTLCPAGSFHSDSTITITNCSMCLPTTYSLTKGTINCINCGEGLNCDASTNGLPQVLPGWWGDIIYSRNEANNLYLSASPTFLPSNQVANTTSTQFQALSSVEYGRFEVSVTACPAGYCENPVVLQLSVANPLDYLNSLQSSTSAAVVSLDPSAVQFSAGNKCGENRYNSPGNSLCGSCASGFIEWNGQCVACDKDNTGLIVGFAILYFVYIGALVFLLRCSSSYVRIFVYFIQAAVLQIGRNDNYISWLSFFNFAPIPAAGGVCLTAVTPYQLLIMQAIIPFIIAMQLVPTAAVHFIVHNMRGANEKFPISSYRRTVVALFLFTYQIIATCVIEYFQCVHVNSATVVYNYPGIDCDSTAYKQWSVIAYLILIGYIGAAPFLLAYYLYFKRNDANFMQSSMLCESFTASAYYSQPLLLGRQIISVIINATLSSQNSYKYLAFTYFNLAALFSTALFNPYKNSFANRL
jgi:hypothetical protein